MKGAAALSVGRGRSLPALEGSTIGIATRNVSGVNCRFASATTGRASHSSWSFWSPSFMRSGAAG